MPDNDPLSKDRNAASCDAFNLLSAINFRFEFLSRNYVDKCPPDDRFFK